MGGYILVADDDEDTREILATVIGSMGLVCKTVSDGIEALACIRDQSPDLILLDLMMPRMDGFTLLFHLKGNPHTRHVPVVIVSGCAPGQGEMLRLPGVAGVMEKSRFSIADMRLVIKEFLKDGRSTGTSPLYS